MWFVIKDIEDWKERRGKFYLGDAKTKATYQFWCPKWGAEQLATGYRIYVDVSYKVTPRIARLKRPYKGVLHFLVGHKNENNEWVPHTTPCASILLEEAHAKSQVFVTAFARLQQLCLQEYGIDIINNTARTELITMGDMEEGLREAVDVLWSHSKRKICIFHFAQALLKKQKHVDIGLWKYCDKDKQIYWYFRNFFVLWAVPPRLVGRFYNCIVRKKGDRNFGYEHVCKKEGKAWIEYFKSNYMNNWNKTMAWNHWYSFVRTNNDLENRNGKVNKMFGPHPYINKFAFRLAKWYQDEYVELQQYIGQGYQRKRRPIEVLKNKLLVKCWEWLETLGSEPSDDHMIRFLKYCNAAVTCSKEKLEEILARREFWRKN